MISYEKKVAVCKKKKPPVYSTIPFFFCFALFIALTQALLGPYHLAAGYKYVYSYVLEHS